MFGDGQYIIGRPDMLCSMFASTATNGLLAQIVNLYYDIANKLYMVNLLSNIRNNDHEFYRLSPELMTKFISKSNLFSKLFFNVVYYQTIVGSSCVILVTSSLAYLEGKFEYSLIILIIWFLFFEKWTKIVVSCGMSLVMSTYISLTFIKLQFRQIWINLKLCRNSRFNVKREKIFDNIRRHHFWTQELDKVDDYLSKIICKYTYIYKLINSKQAIFDTTSAIAYFGFAIPMAVIFGVALDSSQTKFTRILVTFVGSNCLLVIALLTFISAAIHTESDQIRKHLYMLSMKVNSNYRTKWKIQTFIETLTESFIGVNCLNFFHFTSGKFYEYIFIVSSTYFMTSGYFNPST